MTAGPGVRVKICGVGDPETALAAAKAGADALGFVFAPGRRRVTPEQARRIIKILPPLVARVGVFVNAPPEEVSGITAYCGLTAVQLSGDEPPDYGDGLTIPVIRALRAGNGKEVPQLLHYKADAFLFDTHREGSYGGTGESFDWNLLKDIQCPGPLILAGGLSAANVGEAVRLVRPYAVDVSSGVETGGRKDVQKIREFIEVSRRSSVVGCR